MNLIFERYSVERVQKQGFQIVDEELRYVLMSLSAAKIGYRNQRIFSRSYIEKIGNRKINNYKEREWRLVPILDESDEIFPKWVEKISEEEFNQSKEKFSKAIIDSTKSHVIIPTVEIKKAITSISKFVLRITFRNVQNAHIRIVSPAKLRGTVMGSSPPSATMS